MTWVRIDDRYPTHRKMLRAGPLAIALDVAGMCYCAGHATDGFIPHEALPAAAPFMNKRQIALALDGLVAAGRWFPAEGGWLIHDFLVYNPSAAARQADAQSSTQRSRKWRAGRKGDASRGRDGDEKGRTGDATPQGVKASSKSKLALTPVPDPSPTPAASPSLVASGASSAAEPRKPPGQQVSGNGARCRHGNDGATCGVCSAAVGTPPPAAARAELDAVRARTRRGGDTNPTGNEPKLNTTSTETEPEVSAK